MTKEEKIKELKELKDEWSRHIYPKGVRKQISLDTAIKSLEQESILDKVRTEIMDTGAYEQEVNGKTEFLKGINYCLDIIDKYKKANKEVE